MFAPSMRLDEVSSKLSRLWSRAVQRVTKKVLGGPVSILWVPVILLVAIICIPLPFPTGLPLVVLALSLLLNRSRRAKVRYIKFKRQLHPGSRAQRWFDTVDRLLRIKRRKSLWNLRNS